MALQLFTCIVFYIDDRINVMKFRNVNNPEKLYNHCEKSHGMIKYINVYDKQTKDYLYRLNKHQPNSNNSNNSNNTGGSTSLRFG